MLGRSSDFSPIDLVGSLGTNAVATHFACKSDTFRVGMKNKAGEVPAYADFRFLGGAVAALAGQFFGGPTVTRVANDAAVGLLGSYVATETCRRHAIAKLQAAQGAGAAPAQIPEAVPAAKGGGNRNYAYDDGSANTGW